MTRKTLLLAAPALLCGGFLVLRSSAAPSLAPKPALVSAAPASATAPNGYEKTAKPFIPGGQLVLLDKDGKEVGICPLKHTAVKANVAGFVARTHVLQQFENTSKTPVEAVYTFPLPEDAAVDDMRMKIGARLIRGEIKKREEARRIYEAAKSAGQATALLDQERPNIFTQSVANIMPGQSVTIDISFTNLLKYDEGTYEWSFPTVVAPRYTGPVASGSAGGSDPAKITPPVAATRAGHDIDIEVNLEAGFALKNIASPLHPIAIENQGKGRAKISLKDSKTLPNKDFVLRYSVAGQEVQGGLVAYAPSDNQGGYFTLVLQPPPAPPAEDVAPKEMVFVIDQTGSQRGLPIGKAKETMSFCLQNLNPGDTFQLIGFNTAIFPCFAAPVAATPDNIAKALKWLEPIDGNGGTDILKSVDYVLKLKADPKRPRIVCYMTDGLVGNDQQIIEQIAKNRGEVRIFPFGTGNSVNRYLIEGMAREGRGVAQIVNLQEDGKAIAQKFHKRIAQPLLLDVSVDWGNLPVQDVLPQHIPDVFSAAPIILKGRYSRAAKGEITLRGLWHGQPWSETIDVNLPDSPSDAAEALPSLWAREKIKDIEFQSWKGGKGNAQEEITKVALDYRLMSQYTSFVAVEQRVVNIGGQQRTVAVPVEMPDGMSREGVFGGEQLNSLNFARGSALAASGLPMAIGRFSTNKSAAAPAPVSPSAVPPPVVFSPVPRPGLQTAEKAAKLSDGREREVEELTFDSADAKKRLDAMTPEQRRDTLRAARLAPELVALIDTFAKEGVNGELHKKGVPEVTKGRVAVQIWVKSPTKEQLAELKALGFDLAAELLPGKLLLGTLPVAKLDALAALDFVRRAEVPNLK